MAIVLSICSITKNGEYLIKNTYTKDNDREILCLYVSF